MAEDRETIVWSDIIGNVFSPEGAVLVRWLKKDGDSCLQVSLFIGK